MVYEFLPTKTTHFNLAGVLCQAQTGAHLQLIRHTLPGLALLGTCKRIKEEAGTIIQPRLRRLKSQPLRLIANYAALEGPALMVTLKAIAKTMTFPGSNIYDLRKICDENGFLDNLRAYKESELRVKLEHTDVEVAIRETSLAHLSTTERARMALNLYWNVQYEMSAQMDPRKAPDAPLAVRLRPVGLSPEEEQELTPSEEVVDALQGMRSRGRSVLLQCPRIETDEWDNHWVEGERYE